MMICNQSDNIGIVDYLEHARSQIEGKFSEAGRVVESALTVIGSELELLNQLNTVLSAKAVASATRDLAFVADEFNALPQALEERQERLRQLVQAQSAIRMQMEEMRNLLNYLLVFSMNLKIAGTEVAAQAYDFATFSQEMKSRLEQADKELDEFDMRLFELERHIATAQTFESRLAAQANRMLPAIPDRLTKDAAAIDSFHARAIEMTAAVSSLAQNIQMKIVNILSVLQIGDITRQRIEHVQTGLAYLAESAAKLRSEDYSADAIQRFERTVYGLLSAQLGDAAGTFSEDAKSMTALLSLLASDTEALLQTQLAFGGQYDKSGSLRSLESSVAQALELVTDVEKADESANQIHKATSTCVDELATCVNRVRSAQEDVHFMALNTTIRCSRLGDAGKPLEVIAVEVRLYAKKLDAASQASCQSLEALTVAAAESGNAAASRHGESRAKIQFAVSSLREAADVVEHDLASLRTRGEDVVVSLNRASQKLDFEAELIDVIVDAAGTLAERAGEPVSDLTDLARPLREIFDRIRPLYTMAREREVHAQFALTEIAVEDAGERPCDPLLVA